MIVLTGFGAFGNVTHNASARLIQQLEAKPLPEIATVGLILPVSYTAAPQYLDACLTELAYSHDRERKPCFILSMGVHRGDYFRLESTAHGTAYSSAIDNDGLCAVDVAPYTQSTLSTGMDLSVLIDDTVHVLGSHIDMRISHNAGAYVCERVYLHALHRAQALNIDALFLHVPNLETMPIERQYPVVQALLQAIAQRQ